MTYIIKYF